MQLGRAASADAANAKLLLGRWLTGYGLVLLMLLIAIWDIVFKPGMPSGS